MLTMPSFAASKEHLPEHLRQRVSQIEELMFTLIACCNEASPQTDSEVVLSALMSVYLNAALQTGTAQAACENLIQASAALAIEAAQLSAPPAPTTPSNLH